MSQYTGMLALAALLAGGIACSVRDPRLAERMPVVEDPAFLPADEVGFLEDTDLVLGVAIGGEAKAYPVRILGQMEALNDWVGEQPVLATW